VHTKSVTVNPYGKLVSVSTHSADPDQMFPYASRMIGLSSSDWLLHM